MELKTHMETMRKVRGFLGLGVFTPNGEMLEGIKLVEGIHQELIGSAINDVLLNAQDVTSAMSLGDSDFLQIDAAKGTIIARCYNKDGKHFHTVLFMKKDGNIAMGKIMLTKTINDLAKEF